MVEPKVIIRMGSHAEKDYIEKTARYLDGIVVGANLLEATPGATASLLGKKLNRPYYIDPMTYAYGCNLEWIKAPKKKKKGSLFKRSYERLAEKLGEPFTGALSRNSRVTPEDFESEGTTEKCCQTIAGYQFERVKEEFDKDPDYKEYADNLIKPAGIYAPYFYIEPSNAKPWMDLVLLLAKVTASVTSGVPIHAVVCTDESMLDNTEFLDKLRSELPKTGVEGAWFWFSNFNEISSDVERLRAFRSLVEDISKEMQVYNLHGGYFSLTLCKYGLSGISHGVGYGEQKNITPVSGTATPTVRYHLPDFHKRLGVPAIERCFDSLGIKTPDDFHKAICNCVVCKGVVSKELSDFSLFGDMDYSSPTSKRLAQTPAAAKRCRFHFLMSRVRERDELKKLDVRTILENFENIERKWSGQHSVENDMTHVGKWRSALA